MFVLVVAFFLLTGGRSASRKTENLLRVHEVGGARFGVLCLISARGCIIMRARAGMFRWLVREHSLAHAGLPIS
jgi:hypothetical protein